MRLVSLLFVLLLVLPGTAIAQGASDEPIGNLAQLMRGILFPNSNRIFDVQSVDPDAPPEEAGGGSSASSRFASIYTGWPTVENSAIALAEVAKLLMVPGRLCENGNPVPLDQDDYVEGVRLLEEVGKNVLEAARAKDQETVSELTNDMAGACSHCHSIYRDVDVGGGERCK